jgi:F-type H+-transporting ATPase subunit alpha
MTGKTTICTDAIINQKGKNVICIYCCIGKSNAQLAKVVEIFKEHETFGYTIIIAATAATHAGQLYLAPYVACSIGDYFMYNKGNVLVMFDDLTKHAWVYRQISLLLGRAPGRGAYPGDIFYLHSRLVERAAKLNDQLGAGSMTHLPIIETLENDLTAYIPTNLVSMTDGQIFLSSILFNEGFKPAVNIGLSVSRVGSKAQWPIVKKLAGAIRLEYLQYQELLRITKLQASVSKAVKRQLKKGEMLVSFITQYKDMPVSTPELVFLLFSYKHDIPLDLSSEDIEKFKLEVLAHVKKANPKLMDEIENKKKLTDEIDKMLKETLVSYVKTFPSWAKAQAEKGAGKEEEGKK